MKRRRSEITKRKFVLFSIIILFIFFVIEIGVRYTKIYMGSFDQAFPAGITRNANPYIMFKGRAGALINATERHNKYGYRGSAPLVNKDDGEYRIFILGGSTVWNGDPTIPALVQEEFIRNGYHQVKVFNYGVVSSVSSMELARIVFEIVDFKPDVIVMYNGGNDMTHPLSYDPRPGYPFNFIVNENNPLINSSIKNSLLFLIKQFRSIGFLGGNYLINNFLSLDKVRKEAGYGTDQWRDKIAEIYINNIIKARNIAKAFNSNFIVFFQPIIYSKNYVSEKEIRYVNESIKYHHVYLRDAILSKVSDLKKRDGLNFIDLSDLYDTNKETVFIDGIHTTQQAMIPIAKEIYAKIINNFTIPGGERK